MWETRSFFNNNKGWFESLVVKCSLRWVRGEHGRQTNNEDFFLVCHLVVFEFTVLPFYANCQRRDEKKPGSVALVSALSVSLFLL